MPDKVLFVRSQQSVPMPHLAETLAIAALFIAAASLGISAWVAFRDRARLKIISKFVAASDYGPSRVIATMVNVGRRPVILRLIGGRGSDGKWSASFLEREKGGLRLAEHERYEHTFTKDDTVSFHPEHEDFFLEALWVEDSLGTRHSIPKSREYIKKLWS